MNSYIFELCNMNRYFLYFKVITLVIDDIDLRSSGSNTEE